MDRFDLRWPSTDATLYTDGWRCRIVWRQKGGIGGTIDNNALCKRRVADSLQGAPYLLNALMARGHAELARDIEALADLEGAEAPASAADAPQPTRQRAKASTRGPRRAPRKRSDSDVLPTWSEGLVGDGSFEMVGNRRAKVWADLGRLGEEHLFLKAPLPRGKPEWVLKRTWPDSRRAMEFVAAPYFKGIVSYLLGSQPRPDAAFIERLLAVDAIDHEELAAAASGWRAESGGATH